MDFEWNSIEFKSHAMSFEYNLNFQKINSFFSLVERHR
jgi:hypothetical protein